MLHPRKTDVPCGTFAPKVLGFVMLLSGFAALPAHADITPLSSRLTASSLSNIVAGTPKAADTDEDATGSQLANLSVVTDQYEAQPVDLSQTVTASGSVTYLSDTSFVVQLIGTRSGTDSGPSGISSAYDSRAKFVLEFQNLAAGAITVDWNIPFERDYQGTIAPLGVGLRWSGVLDAVSPTVDFNTGSGTSIGSHTFDLTTTGASGRYWLELELYMAGQTSNLAPPEHWTATFAVTTPRMTITPVPEPTTVVMLSAGLALLGAGRLRRRWVPRRQQHLSDPRGSLPQGW